jgi:hypothetical protein
MVVVVVVMVMVVMVVVAVMVVMVVMVMVVMVMVVMVVVVMVMVMMVVVIVAVVMVVVVIRLMVAIADQHFDFLPLCSCFCERSKLTLIFKWIDSFMKKVTNNSFFHMMSLYLPSKATLSHPQ